MPEIHQLLQNLRTPLHFTGVGGTGMSALAQLRAFAGGAVTGSDRAFDRGEMCEERAALAQAGVRIVPQDGSGVLGAAAVVVSTAIENDVADAAAARAAGVPILHRADLLAAYVEGDSVGVAGTSGKSTVTAMTFEILARAGRDPGLVTGGRLLSLMRAGKYGNAAAGRGPLVFEADESDGSLVKHAPHAAVVLNLHKDHMEEARVIEQFTTFASRTRGPLVVSDDPGLGALRERATLVFGFGDDLPRDAIAGEALALGPDHCAFTARGVRFRVPFPGAHVAFDALAAAGTAHAIGVDLATCAAALAEFGGVHRRFETIGERRGVVVIDDFAHNPEKVAAAIRAAQDRAGARGRVVALFQPHGYAPMRFFRNELAAAFASALRPADRAFVLPVFFAGGTAVRDLTERDLADDAARLGAPVEPIGARDEAPARVSAIAREGDIVLSMGARDPALPALARAIVAAL